MATKIESKNLIEALREEENEEEEGEEERPEFVQLEEIQTEEIQEKHSPTLVIFKRFCSDLSFECLTAFFVAEIK